MCGGETFLWKDGDKTIRDLVKEAKEMGFLIVNVVTNGTFPLDLPEADLIMLSLDGDKNKHNMIRGDMNYGKPFWASRKNCHIINSVTKHSLNLL